ncbi:MAG: TonB-dependent receptor domain-containing protein [Janthinobacterium lividum]
MKNYYFLYFLVWLWALLGSYAAAAQAPPPINSGSLTGTVLDSVSRQPVAYATVVLLPPAPGETPLSGAAADDQGQFKLSQLPAGAFRLRVLFVGYAPRTLSVVVGAGATAVGTILLPSAAQKLGEVVVTGTKPLVEVRPDRLVYNAAQDVSNAGGTAQDVLRKAPLLAVDGDGNVTMRGSANFKVLVNNRPAPTLAKNLADALANIPADQIQRVEVITTPPAQYDGEGTAGLINIVLKKGVAQRANGQVSLSSGNRDTRLRAALNFRKRKLSFTSALSAGALYRPGGSDLTRLGYGPVGTDTLRRSGSRRFRQQSIYSTAGLDYALSEHQTLLLATVVDYYSVHTLSDLLTRYAAPVPTSNYLFARATDEPIAGFDAEVTAAYTRTFAQPRKEWSVLGQGSFNPSTFGYDFQQFDRSPVTLADQQATYRERSRGRAPSHEGTLQTDFVQPLGEHRKLSLGAKAIFRRTGAVATIDTLRTRYGPTAAQDGSRATDFSYAQNVQAAYASYEWAVGKQFTASLGSRLERTSISADFRTNATSFDRAYLTLLPNGFAQYTLSEASSVRAAYSRRITRPFIDFLNPFVDRSQPGVVSYGNPYLDPELTDSYELSYNTSVKSTSFNAAASVRHTGNAIEQVRLPTADPSIIASTYANVAATSFYQVNLSASLKPHPGWDLSFGPDVQYLVLRSPALQADRRGLTAALTVNTSYKLPKGYAVQGFFYGALPQVQVQGRTWASPYYSFGVKKLFWQERADLSLNVSCPFTPHWAQHTTTTTLSFDQQNTSYQLGQQSFRLALAYRFGQQQSSRARKAIENDDKKSGGKQDN